jgi:hypothetical protein
MPAPAAGLVLDGEHHAIGWHRKSGETSQRSWRQLRCGVLAVLAFAGACAIAMLARDTHTVEMLAWINYHGDGQLGYNGLRTTMPGEVAYATPTSATPLFVPGRGMVAPYPMPYTGMIHRARAMTVVQQPAIRLSTTTSFSDSPAVLPGQQHLATPADADAAALSSAAAGSWQLRPSTMMQPSTTMNGIYSNIGAPTSQWYSSAPTPQLQLAPPAYMHPQVSCVLLYHVSLF